MHAVQPLNVPDCFFERVHLAFSVVVLVKHRVMLLLLLFNTVNRSLIPLRRPLILLQPAYAPLFRQLFTLGALLHTLYVKP